MQSLDIVNWSKLIQVIYSQLDLNWEKFFIIFVCLCLSTTLLLFFKDSLAVVVKITRLIVISYEKSAFHLWQFFQISVFSVLMLTKIRRINYFLYIELFLPPSSGDAYLFISRNFSFLIYSDIATTFLLYYSTLVEGAKTCSPFLIVFTCMGVIGISHWYFSRLFTGTAIKKGNRVNSMGKYLVKESRLAF